MFVWNHSRSIKWWPFCQFFIILILFFTLNWGSTLLHVCNITVSLCLKWFWLPFYIIFAWDSVANGSFIRCMDGVMLRQTNIITRDRTYLFFRIFYNAIARNGVCVAKDFVKSKVTSHRVNMNGNREKCSRSH